MQKFIKDMLTTPAREHDQNDMSLAIILCLVFFVFFSNTHVFIAISTTNKYRTMQKIIDHVILLCKPLNTIVQIHSRNG